MNYNYDEEKLNAPVTSLIIFTFLGVFNWALFYYIGKDIKSKIFIYLGRFYFTVSMLFILSVSFKADNFGPFILVIAILGYFVGIVYFLISIPYYKKRISLLGKLTAIDLLNTNIYNLNNLELEVLVNNKNYIYENNNTPKDDILRSIKNESNSFFITLLSIFSYFGIFNSILFYCAGFETKDKKYTNIGHFFLVLSILFIPCFLILKDPLLTFIFLICIMGQLFGIIYSYLVRVSYKKRINLLNILTACNFLKNDIKNLNNLELEVLINDINLNINKSKQNSSFDNNKNTFDNSNPIEFTNIIYQELPSEDQDTNKKSDKIFEKININSATEEELLTLTEFTPELAKKIISIRKTINGFKSMDEFELLTNIKPHISRNLSDKITFDAIQSNTAPNNKKERILDI